MKKAGFSAPSLRRLLWPRKWSGTRDAGDFHISLDERLKLYETELRLLTAVFLIAEKMIRDWSRTTIDLLELKVTLSRVIIPSYQEAKRAMLLQEAIVNISGKKYH